MQEENTTKTTNELSPSYNLTPIEKNSIRDKCRVMIEILVEFEVYLMKKKITTKFIYQVPNELSSFKIHNL